MDNTTSAQAKPVCDIPQYVGQVPLMTPPGNHAHTSSYLDESSMSWEEGQSGARSSEGSNLEAAEVSSLSNTSLWVLTKQDLQASGGLVCARCSSREISLNHLWADHQSIYHWALYLHWTLTRRNSEYEQQRQAYCNLQSRHERARNQLRASDIEVGKLTMQLRQFEPLVVALKRSKRRRSNTTD
jgi:hypothetical protein